jgi:hypothetical protein
MSQESIDFDPNNWIPSGRQSLAYELVSIAIGVAFAAGLVTALYFMFRKRPEDYFVSKALVFLILALATRLLMSTKVYFADANREILMVDGANSSEQSVPWQEVYFELPFYLFMIVPMSMLFSWRLAYLKICEFV